LRQQRQHHRRQRQRCPRTRREDEAMMLVQLLLLILVHPEISFEKLAPHQRPTLEAVKEVLAVRAVGNIAFTLLSGSESYLTRWHLRVVIDIDWQLDDNRVVRVTRLKFRLKTKGEAFFYYRRGP